MLTEEQYANFLSDETRRMGGLDGRQSRARAVRRIPKEPRRRRDLFALTGIGFAIAGLPVASVFGVIPVVGAIAARDGLICRPRPTPA